jgi:5-methylcytosine-specific restriction endonuclease McrA
MGLKHFRHSAAVTRSARWKIVRLAAKRRDGFRCVKCGARGRLEVDHIEPVRTHPELSFDLTNLQTLCGRCHSRKTAIEVGMTPIDPKRQAWRDLLAAVAQPQRKETSCWSL